MITLIGLETINTFLIFPLRNWTFQGEKIIFFSFQFLTLALSPFNSDGIGIKLFSNHYIPHFV